jgi:hypothetical protein
MTGNRNGDCKAGSCYISALRPVGSDLIDLPTATRLILDSARLTGKDSDIAFEFPSCIIPVLRYHYFRLGGRPFTAVSIFGHQITTMYSVIVVMFMSCPFSQQ